MADETEGFQRIGPVKAPTAPLGTEGFERVQPAAPAPTDAFGDMPDRGPSFAARFWQGVTDPAMGAAQLRAHYGVDSGVMPVPTGQMRPGSAGALLQQQAQQPRLTAGQADTMAQEREQTYQQQRQQGAEGGKLGFDWARLLGGFVGTAPLAAIPGAAATTTLGRGIGPLAIGPVTSGMIGGAAGGAAGGAVSPVTGGGNYAAEKAMQIGGGAAVGGALGGLAGAISRIPASTVSMYRRFIAPTPKGLNKFEDLTAANQKITDSVNAIVAAKKNLELGEEKAILPQTVQQFSQAIGQVKQQIFEQYDKLAREAEMATPGPNTTVMRFNQEFDRASMAEAQAQRAVREANRKVLLAKAQQHRAGESVYSSAAANRKLADAEVQLRGAQTAQERAATIKSEAFMKLRGVWVDLEPTVRELNKIAHSVVGDTHPAVTTYAAQLADRLASRGAYAPSQAQDVIQRFNAGLNAFYENPTYENAVRTSVDAMVANRLRSGLDKAIESAGGSRYQELRNLYGSLSSIEKDVTKRAARLASKGGHDIFSSVGNLFSAKDVLHGLVNMNPSAMAPGVLMRLMVRGAEKLRSPDRGVRRMFGAAERKPPGIVRRSIGTGLAGAAPGAGEAIGTGLQ